MSTTSAGLALVSSGLWGASDFLGGSLSRRMRTVHVLLLSQAVAAVVVVTVVAVTGGLTLTGGWLWWSLAAGTTWAAAMAALYTALSRGTMGVVAPIASTGASVPVLVGLAAGERPGSLALVGVVVALLGVVASAGPDLGRSRGAAGTQRSAVVLAIAAAVLFGIEISCLSRGSAHSVAMTLVGMRLSALACVAVVVVRWRRRARHRAGLGMPTGRDGAVLLALGVLDLAATATYGLASQSGLVSLVAVLASLYPAVTVLLARRFHHERLTAVQVVGVAAVLVGAVGIAAGSGA